jgi:hypothetical protein
VRLLLAEALAPTPAAAAAAAAAAALEPPLGVSPPGLLLPPAPAGPVGAGAGAAPPSEVSLAAGCGGVLRSWWRHSSGMRSSLRLLSCGLEASRRSARLGVGGWMGVYECVEGKEGQCTPEGDGRGGMLR